MAYPEPHAKGRAEIPAFLRGESVRLPYMRTVIRQSEKSIGSFLGLNKQLVIQENEFSDMKNMSTDRFPAITVRKKRGEVLKTIGKPNGLFYKNGLAYVDGTSLYYKDAKIADVTDGRKQIVGIGAYMVVFPDKIMYNTHTGELSNLEASWMQSTVATFAQTTEGSTLVKISCAGIGKSFSKYDGVVMSGCSNEDFNKSFVIQDLSENYLVVIGSLEEQFAQNSGLAVNRTVPDMDYVCENENRLWGCSSANHEIYSSKLGDPANWQAFEGISTDSYAVTVGSDGDFTGCISHLGYVLFFKEDTIHKVFGNKPSNYQVTAANPVRGIAKGMERTACITNETLLYAARNEICSYDGAQPESVSDQLEGEKFVDGVASHLNGKYYASLKKENGTWGIYVYDLKRGIWMKEDEMRLVDMVYGEGTLYCVDGSGNLFTMVGKRDEEITWHLESGELLEGTIDNKYVKKLKFHMKMQAGSEVNIMMQYDEEPAWEVAGTYKARSFRTQSVSIIPRRCQKYRYRLEGRGEVTLIAMSRIIGIGSGINGGI